ncbi:MAG: efflux RND transporter periplasmic adaptor subunit [Candidatus Cloacimonetes bacterium]|nr:efflux RND transporter periplasmic adaptor subunit [Candidatus Cloacimonadota bacterium]
MLKKILLLSTVFIIFITACQQDAVQEKSEFAGKRNVITSAAYLGDINEYLEFSGKIEAEIIANTGPAMSAKIDKIMVEIGDHVTKDQLLVKLDKTQLEQTRIQFENVQKNYNRMQKLLENEAIDQKTFDEVEAGFNTLRNSYNYMLDNIELKAPIPGMVTHIYKKEGEKFDAMMDPFLIRIVNQNKFKAKFMVSDRDINLLEKGQTAIIKIENSDKVVHGKVSYISPEADVMSGKYPVEIKIDSNSNLIRHNQFARITVVTKTSKKTMIIPQKAVLENDLVFVITDGIAHKREVITGIGNEQFIEIKQGIEEDTRVIISGNIGLSDGDAVEVIDQEL